MRGLVEALIGMCVAPFTVAAFDEEAEAEAVLPTVGLAAAAEEG